MSVPTPSSQDRSRGEEAALGGSALGWPLLERPRQARMQAAPPRLLVIRRSASSAIAGAVFQRHQGASSSRVALDAARLGVGVQLLVRQVAVGLW